MALADGYSVGITTNGEVTGNVYGARAGNSGGNVTAINNSVTISGTGKVTGYIYGGLVNGGDSTNKATGNTVNINGGSVVGGICGGYLTSSGEGANGNTVNISGGTVSGDIYGGRVNSGTGSAINNTVTISTSGAIYNNIWGGWIAGITADIFTGNTLNFHTSGLTVGNVYNFEKLNFFLPSALMSSTTPLLTVTGIANLTDGGGTTQGSRSSVVNVGIDGASSLLQAGDSIVLIDAATLVTNGLNCTANGQGMQGVTLKYDFDISATSTQLIATVRDTGPNPGPTLNPQTKAFSEAWLSQLAFANQGADLIADQGLFAALDATASRTEQTTVTFGTLSGGTSRYNTGSHSDVSGVSLIAGLAGSTRQPLGKLTLGAFFEYGDATYDSYNSFVNAASVRGRGGLDYTGGGVLAHLEFNPTARGNAWLESSARFGEASVDFRTNDMGLGQHAAFGSNNNYAAAHFGLGYHRNLTKRNGFDFYAQYLWSRQNADTVVLTTGETVNFEEANSERLRLGSRFVYAVNTSRRAYAGIAWEHEFGGVADASVLGYRLDAAKLMGDTCKLELGLALLPTKRCRFTRNFGLQGYAGKREGVAGSLEVRYAF